jgi:glycosyltransferase involved in cell wall biosynthesis
MSKIMSKTKSPQFSIITAVLNNKKTLEKTIRSVSGQEFKNFEYILIDGGSVDGSLKIINRYRKKINKVISEKDKGIYDAFNKGMKLAKGKYICIVNSDDTLKKNSLKIINNYILKNPDIDFIFGSVKKHWGVLYGYRPEKINYSWGFYSSHSTGFYIKKSSAKKVGYYNLKYRYHADYDYFYRMIVHHKMKGISTKKKEIVGVFGRGGYSSVSPYREQFFEELRIRRDNGQNLLLILFIAAYKLIKHFRKIVL